MNFNKAILAGHLTARPELKTTSNGTSVTSFTIAVNRMPDKDGNVKADFINCVAWKKTAEFISNYFDKGSPICVEGEIQTRSWEDQNGQKRYATEVIAYKAMFTESKKDGASPAPQADPQFTEIDNDDELPFD